MLYPDIAIHCHSALPDVFFFPFKFWNILFQIEHKFNFSLFDGVQLMINSTVLNNVVLVW